MDALDLGQKTVCLLGPVGGGKSSLLRTLRKCLALDGHGYAVDAIKRFEIIDIDRQTYDTDLTDYHDEILVRPPEEADEFAQQEEYFTKAEAMPSGGASGMPTKPSEPLPRFYFSLNWVWVNGSPSGRCRLQIVDSPGELSAAHGRNNPPTEEALNLQRDELDKELLQAQGLVIVIPPADGRPEPWVSPLFKAVSRLLDRPAKSRRLERIVVVFSKYDRLFAWCGKDAAGWAIQCETMLHVLRRELLHRESLQPLRELFGRVDRSEPRIELVVTAASALGFTRRFGNPNQDPNPKHPDELEPPPAGTEGYPNRFRTGEAPGDYSRLWRPFLTADPFIFAATGLGTIYMMSAEDFLPPSAGAAAASHPEGGPDGPPPSDGPPASPSVLGRGLNWLKSTFDASSTG